MGLMDRRPVVCRNLAMGFWVPLHYLPEKQDRPYLCYGGISSHGKTYQSRRVFSEGHER